MHNRADLDNPTMPASEDGRKRIFAAGFCGLNSGGFLSRRPPRMPQIHSRTDIIVRDSYPAACRSSPTRETLFRKAPAELTPGLASLKVTNVQEVPRPRNRKPARRRAFIKLD